MFDWNGIKIYVEGVNQEFISEIGHFFYASCRKFKREDCDILFSIYDGKEQILPSINQNARHVKSNVLFVEKEFKLDIYSHNEQLWYLYQGVAGIWIDFRSNRIILSPPGKLFSFSYYNILFFFLYPLSLLLENFGYYRLHASCINIENKAALFTGESGSGKSTSAFAIAANGGSIISDDMTFVKKAGDFYYTYTITQLVKLRNDMILRFFPEFLRYESLKNAGDERYFNVDDVNRNCPALSVLKAIVILEKTGSKISNFSGIHPSKVVPHLFPSAIRTNIEKFTRREFIFLTDLLNDIRCYKFYFGTDMPDFYKNVTNVLDKDTL